MVRFSLPGSKSISNRVLLCAALATGKSTLTGLLDCDDTRLMVDALRQLGVEMNVDYDLDSAKITGCNGEFPITAADLYVGNSGTTIRFLAAALSTRVGSFRLDGVARMRQRPIARLVHSLQQLGVGATAHDQNQFPPVNIQSRGWSGHRVSVSGNESSQFLSGLLLAAPYAAQSTTISVTGALVSLPYVHMTLDLMRQFGAEYHVNQQQFTVDAGKRYEGRVFAIEPDASAASYFWAAAAITGGSVKVAGLSSNSLQGDVKFCDCLQQMGCTVNYAADSITVSAPARGRLRGIHVDMNSISDTVPTLAVVALFADGPTTVTNVAHIRHKETDRIGDLARELRKLGAGVTEYPDGLVIVPGSVNSGEIDTYEDHRIAMAFAIAGLRIPGVKIRDPGCTAKTYPKFFADLTRMCANEKLT